MKIEFQLQRGDYDTLLKNFLVKGAHEHTQKKIKSHPQLLLDRMIGILRSRIIRKRGIQGKWSSVTQNTLLVRNVKKQLGYKNILSDTNSKEQVNEPRLLADIEKRTTFTNHSTDVATILNFKVESNLIDTDVSNTVGGSRITSLRYMNDTTLRVGNHPIHANKQALVIPIPKQKVQSVVDLAFADYIQKRPGTQKRQIATSADEKGKGIFSWRDAGIIQSGKAVWAFRPFTRRAVGLIMGGRRNFLLAPFSEREKQQIVDAIATAR